MIESGAQSTAKVWKASANAAPPGRRVGRADAGRTGVAGAVDGAVHGVRLEADVLHDVDLAAVRPADLSDVLAQHPERRPHALAPRDLHPGLDVPVLLASNLPEVLSRAEVYWQVPYQHW